MKFITFAGAGMLAGLAMMLESYGYDVTDREIACGMEAPYLFAHDQEGYKAGAMLYRPAWLNLYLRPMGLCMLETRLDRQEVCAYLRAHAPAMLMVTVARGVAHPVVFTGYREGRYAFDNIRAASSAEPGCFSFTAATLKRRIAEAVTVYHLEKCSPQRTDFIPLLFASLENLDRYQGQLLAVRQRTMTRQAFDALHTPLFRALMQDIMPLIQLNGDDVLAEELRLLRHDYRHVFVHDDGQPIALDEHLPRHSIKKCILWLKEDIVDRIHQLADDDLAIERLLDEMQAQ